MRIAISSGHSHRDPGAVGIFRERDENVRVADELFRRINDMPGHSAVIYHDNTSTSSRENVNQTAAWHNRQNRDWDVQIHFNSVAGGILSRAIGTETLYRSPNNLLRCRAVSRAIAKAGLFIDRGPKQRTNLGFLNLTNQPALLPEICFVNSTVDERLYRDNFNAICQALAEALVA